MTWTVNGGGASDWRPRDATKPRAVRKVEARSPARRSAESSHQPYPRVREEGAFCEGSAPSSWSKSREVGTAPRRHRPCGSGPMPTTQGLTIKLTISNPNLYSRAKVQMTKTAKTGGRTAGTPNRRTIASRRQIQAMADPLAFLVRVMNGEVIDNATPTLADRISAARELRRVLVPDAKDAPTTVDLPEIRGSADLLAGVNAILSAVAAGEITPGEGKAMVDLLEAARKAYEACDLSERLAVLEGPSWA